MNVDALATFLVIVERGSVAEAARRLNLPQTTVAQQMKALEADVGNRLLARVGRNLKPTVSGVRILERAQQIVNEVRDLRSVASSGELPAGPLLLGATYSALMGLLPPVLREWSRLFPSIKINIEPDDSLPLISKVCAGELDAALVVHPLFLLPKTCNWLTLREEKLILLAPASLKVKDILETLTKQPYIRFDRRVTGGKLADEFLHRHKIKPNAQFELDGIDEVAKFVSEGLGVSLLPDWATIGQPDTSVRRWKLPTPCPHRSVGMLWSRSSARLELAEAILNLLSQRWRKSSR